MIKNNYIELNFYEGLGLIVFLLDFSLFNERTLYLILKKKNLILDCLIRATPLFCQMSLKRAV